MRVKTLVVLTSFASSLLAAPRAQAQELPAEQAGASTGGTESQEEPQTRAKPEAAAAPAAVSREDLLGVRNEIAALRDEWRRALDRNTANTQRALKLGGFIQTRYTHYQRTSGIDGAEIGNAQLTLRGSLRRDYARGRNLEYGLGFLTAPQTFNVQPADAFISFSILPSLDVEKPYLYAVLGQQKKVFGLEPQATEEKAPAIRLAQFATRLDLQSRDAGLLIRGDLLPSVDVGFGYRVPIVEYYAQIINGAGPNKLDDNKHKDTVARIVLNAPSVYNSIWRGLSLGASRYDGRRNLAQNGATIRGLRQRTGLDLAYVRTPVGFTVEWTDAKDDAFVSAKAQDTRNVSSRGFVATVFYNFGQQFVRGYRNQVRYDDWWPITFQPFVRYDRYDPDRSVSGNLTTVVTLGFNAFFAETTKFQINYNFKAEEKGGGSVKNDELLLQFQYGF